MQRTNIHQNMSRPINPSQCHNNSQKMILLPVFSVSDPPPPVATPTPAPAPALNPSQQAQSPKPEVQQNSQGATDSPNVNINGNNNPVTINNSDPAVKARLDEIENLLKAQQKPDDLTPAKLLAKYPLGYVIYDINYQNSVFPYQTKVFDKWNFDWSTAKVTTSPDGLLLVTLPDMTSKSGSSLFKNFGVLDPQEGGAILRKRHNGF